MKARSSNPEIAFKIVNGRIKPILCYKEELWESEPCHQIEQVQIGFCKFILGFGQSAQLIVSELEEGHANQSSHANQSNHEA